MAFVYYSINHIVHGDIHFAKKFYDQELWKARDGQIENSEKEIYFANYLFNSFKDDTTYNAKNCTEITSMIEVLMNEAMRETHSQIDKYLKFFER